MAGQEITTLVNAMTFMGAGIAMGFGAVGAGAGEGLTAALAVKGMARQPRVQGELLRTMLLGQALTESPSIFALMVALMMIFSGEKAATLSQAAAMIAAGVSVGFSAICSGVGTGLVSATACRSIARQPEVGGRISGIMLLGQAVDTSPSVFGFIIALLLIIQPQEIDSLPRAAALLGAGVAMSIGTLGSGLAIGWIASRACTFVGYRPAVAGLVTRTMLLGGAIAETLGIFSFVVALLLLSTT